MVKLCLKIRQKEGQKSPGHILDQLNQNESQGPRSPGDFDEPPSLLSRTAFTVNQTPLRFTVGWALSAPHTVWLLAGSVHLLGGSSSHCCFCFPLILLSAYSCLHPDLEDLNKTPARFYNSWQHNKKCTYVSFAPQKRTCVCVYL